MSMHCQSCSNLVPIRCKSNGNLKPILCQFSNPMSIHSQSYANPVPILCRSIAIQELPILINNPIHCQSDVNSVSIPCQSTPIHANPVPILHQSSTNLMSIQSINMASIWCQSTANPMSIQNQSAANQKPIGCQSSSPGRHFIANPLQMQYQSDLNAVNPVPI